MKELINIFVKDYRMEGFTRREWMMGDAFCVAIVAVCLLAEIINAL